MNNLSISSNQITLKQGDNSLDFLGVSFKEIYITNEVNSNSSLLIKNLQDVNCLKIDIKENSQLTLSVLFEKQGDNLEIQAGVSRDSTLVAYFADFSKDLINLNCVVNLKENNASSFIKVASLSSNKDDKNISISINHLAPQTYGKVDSYGVCKDSGRLLFAGTSHIFEKAIKSKTQQNAKIMVFDEASNAIAKPILKIDENDIEASHAAVVGKINDEHLFYLTSRGISEADAKQLITLGYLKPILAGFSDNSTREYISSLIERRM